MEVKERVKNVVENLMEENNKLLKENKKLKKENKKQQKMIDELTHSIAHKETKMTIIQSHSRCCRNSANPCEGCLSCCG